MSRWVWTSVVGMLGGFAGNCVLGGLFSADIVRGLLYDPDLQSALFIEVTSQRDIWRSVGGLILLSATHGWLYARFAGAMRGEVWWHKGLYWGAVLWVLYWVPQEWFVYHRLLREPFLLNLVELSLLAVGSAVEGLVIAWCLRNRSRLRA